VGGTEEETDQLSYYFVGSIMYFIQYWILVIFIELEVDLFNYLCLTTRN